MQFIRRSHERGHADHGWLKSYHTFSFADYFDPRYVEFGPLRVINEDWIQPGQGFGTHGHSDMEIITYVLSGALSHKDSMGTGSTIREGDLQRMSAGTGIRHSEFNASNREPVHLLQIWIQPNVRGIAPSYEQRHFAASDRRGRLRLVASPDGTGESVLIHQNARLYAGLFDAQEHARLALDPGRSAYVQVARGELSANDTVLQAGDALALTDARELRVQRGRDAEVLVFDLPDEAG